MLSWWKPKSFACLVLVIAMLGLAACGDTSRNPTLNKESKPSAKNIPGTASTIHQNKSDTAGELEGTFEIDGSSTVFPLSQAVAEEFRKIHPKVQIPIGISGTGGGFKRFVVGETQISDASRLIKDSEKKKAIENGIEFLEITVAFDGLSIIVHPSNNFADCITVDELKNLWAPESPVKKWSDIRDGWPDKKIRLYGPDTDSGTFDYFTEAIVGEEDASRSDYTASADDNVLVQGVGGDRYSLGYFGYSYYLENTDKLKLIAIDHGKGCIQPNAQNINDGSYSPLSRPLFIYANKSSIRRPEVAAFLEFYMEHAAKLAEEVGYVGLPNASYNASLEKIKNNQ